MNREQRPATSAIPDYILTSGTLEEFVNEYYDAQPSQGKFQITRFVVYEEENAIVLEFENSTPTSGSGAVVGYEYDENYNVTYMRMFNMFIV